MDVSIVGKRAFLHSSTQVRKRIVRKSFVLELGRGKFRAVFKRGNTRMIIHSDLMCLSNGERREWFRRELEKGNPVLKEIERVVNEIYWKRMGNITKSPGD